MNAWTQTCARYTVTCKEIWFCEGQMADQCWHGNLNGWTFLGHFLFIPLFSLFKIFFFYWISSLHFFFCTLSFKNHKQSNTQVHPHPVFFLNPHYQKNPHHTGIYPFFFLITFTHWCDCAHTHGHLFKLDSRKARVYQSTTNRIKSLYTK